MMQPASCSKDGGFFLRSFFQGFPLTEKTALADRKQLEGRTAKQTAMDRVAAAAPIRGEELSELLGGIADIKRLP